MQLDVYFRRANGLWAWRGDYTAPAPLSVDNVNVTLWQNGLRVLSLQTCESLNFDTLLDTALDITKLIQLGEGYGHIIDGVGWSASKDTEPIRTSFENLKKEKRVIDFYTTHKNFIRKEFELVSAQNIISQANYSNWKSLYEKLTLQHHAFLYFTTDNGLPISLRMANLIELCEPLALYCSVEIRKDGVLKEQTSSQKGSSLKKCIKYLIDKYGQVIFEQETNHNILGCTCQNCKICQNRNGDKSILQRLVNTRVNTMHYKRNPEDSFIDWAEKGKTSEQCGGEMVIYCAKIHLLYRVTMLELSKIPVCPHKIKAVTNYIETAMLPHFDFADYISKYTASMGAGVN